MLATASNTAIYTGSTSDLKLRLHRHKEELYLNAFTAKYHCLKLVYFRGFPDMKSAKAEEKRLKGGSRKKKIDLIMRLNPNWKDLGTELFGPE
jgi:putative endonuclease